jgi:small conductance mechanosensitive channel
VPQFAANVISHHPITHKLNREQKDNLQKVEKHLIAIAQIAIWVSAIVIILGLFPYTRPFQVSVLSALEIPLIIAVVIVVSYVGTRLSYIAINRVISSFAESQIIKAQDSRRLELRVSTISSLLKSTALFTWIAIGSIVALSLVGVSLGALIAGAGVIGLLITLGSQNLIKGAINSFFFVLEDQFAVGDVIVVENMNQLGGVVEDMNLRITQLRDAKGRLVTLPNSEIKSVVNFSYEWARSDLKIPVPYNTDINQVIDVINTVAQEMNEDPDWKEDILEEPTLLGIDDFSDRGLLVRLWIKVKPMKQWDVSREYRRRLKLALDSENLHIGLHQEEIWVNPNLPMQVSMNDDNNTVNEPGNEDGNQAVKTGHQGNVDNARERDDSEGEEKY